MNTLTSIGLSALLEHPVVRTVAVAFEQADRELFLVGGCVRDALDTEATTSFDDLDFTTEASPDEIENILTPLGPLWTVGKEFGTVGVQVDGQKVEVTTFRGETYTSDSRKPMIHFAKTLEDDLSRRDFTINAMALNTRTGEIVDPFGGQNALGSRILITPNPSSMETIVDDPLRSIRALRFSVTRNFRMSILLEQAIVSHRDRLDIVARERINEELRKIIRAGGRAVLDAWFESVNLGIDSALFGEMGTIDTPAPFKAAREADDFDGITAMAWLHHFTPITSTRDPLMDLKLSNEEVDAIIDIGFIASKADTLRPEVARTTLRHFKDRPDTVLRGVRLAEILGADTTAFVEATRDERIVGPMPLGGDDLIGAGIKPGPKMGMILDTIERAWITDLDMTHEFAIEFAKHLDRKVTQ